MEVIRGVQAKNLIRQPDFGEYRLSDVDSLYKGVQELLSLYLIFLEQ
jgi:hypothetical protein